MIPPAGLPSCYRTVTPIWPGCYPVVAVPLCGLSKVHTNGIRARGAEEYEEGKGMKRTTGALVTMLVVVFLAAGPALAALPLIVGTDHAEQIKGTNNAEEIRGLGGSDEIVDGRGKDAVYGGSGADDLIGYGGDTSLDRFSGGGGDDTVQSRDVPAVRDIVRCGAGTDEVYADKADVASEDCERVNAW
jgi:Ca2+-binding RTX toxin-like protein